MAFVKTLAIRQLIHSAGNKIIEPSANLIGLQHTACLPKQIFSEAVNSLVPQHFLLFYREATSAIRGITGGPKSKFQPPPSSLEA